MKHSVFLIAHPRKFVTINAEFMSTVELGNEFGELLEAIDVFCINAKDFENCRHLLSDSKNFLEALQTDSKTESANLWQDQLKAVANFEHALKVIDAEGGFLFSDNIPDALRRCVSDATRMRCDRGWAMYLADKSS